MKTPAYLQNNFFAGDVSAIDTSKILEFVEACTLVMDEYEGKTPFEVYSESTEYDHLWILFCRINFFKSVNHKDLFSENKKCIARNILLITEAKLYFISRFPNLRDEIVKSPYGKLFLVFEQYIERCCKNPTVNSYNYKLFRSSFVERYKKFKVDSNSEQSNIEKLLKFIFVLFEHEAIDRHINFLDILENLASEIENFFCIEDIKDAIENAIKERYSYDYFIQELRAIGVI